MTIKIPYGRIYLEADIPDNRLVGILAPKKYSDNSEAWEESLVLDALENPIGSKRLKDLVKDKRRIVIITSDHTRPVPTRIMAPMMLAEIRKGNKNIDVTFLVATGYHQPPTKDELINKFGEYIVCKEKILIHDPRDYSKLKYAGKLPSGSDFFVSKTALETDLLVAEGIIEPHYLAGFSGGRDSILPGIAGWDTILTTHSAAVIASEQARPGVIDDNPLNREMGYAAKTVKLDFILNVALDTEGKIIKAFGGDAELAHKEGCRLVDELATVSAKKADIVIASCGGQPADRDIYQTVKGMMAPEMACRTGGVIIMCAACGEGHGNEAFFSGLADVSSSEMALAQIMDTASEHTTPGQWRAQVLGRVLTKHQVIIVTEQCDHKLITNMHMKAADNLPEALRMAEEIVGAKAMISVIPNGISVIVK